MPSSSPRDRFGIRFSMLSRLWRRTIDQQMAAVGLSDISWAPLIHLAESGDGVSQKELASLVGIDGSSLVRLLDTLESRDRKSTRLNSSHVRISYAVFC